MNFQSSYAKLLADPGFGTIKKRKEHAREMYLEGMKRAAEVIAEAAKTSGLFSSTRSILQDAVDEISDAIAEESK